MGEADTSDVLLEAPFDHPRAVLQQMQEGWARIHTSASSLVRPSSEVATSGGQFGCGLRQVLMRTNTCFLACWRLVP